MAEGADEVPRGIRSEMVTLSGMFTKDLVYKMPPFQRPYSWTDEEVDCLVEDLRVATAFEYPYYFLGHIVVHEREDEGFVIDGQQRLATLTVLIAYLRDRTSDRTLAHALQRLIASGVRGAVEPRLLLRKLDWEFFREFIQTPGGIPALLEKRGLRVKPQRLLQVAARRMAGALDELIDQEREAMARFLANRVTFNLIQTDDLEGAAALFRAINYRGIRPNASSIIKSELLEHARFSDEEASRVADEWDALEDELGEKGMSELWAMIEVIVSGRAPSDKQNPRSFRARVIDQIDVAKFLREDFGRYLSTWRAVQRCKVNVGAASAEVNRRIACMHLYRERGWVAPAVSMLADYRGDADACKRFFRGLDRITFACVMGAMPGRSRFDRFARIVRARGVERDLYGRSGAFLLTAQQTKALGDKLNERIGLDDNRAKLVAFRLNSALGGEVLGPNDDATLEHVLPKTADTDYWLKKFPNEDRREEYRHLIGNFVLLTEDQNSAAAANDWPTKQRIFFNTPDTPLRALTADIQKYKDWDETALRNRHYELVEVLRQDLELTAVT